jgi:hypothetical protein
VGPTPEPLLDVRRHPHPAPNSSHPPYCRRTCDYLLILSRGRIQVSCDIDQLLEKHRILIGPRVERSFETDPTLIQFSHSGRETTLLVCGSGQQVTSRGSRTPSLSMISCSPISAGRKQGSLHLFVWPRPKRRCSALPGDSTDAKPWLAPSFSACSPLWSCSRKAS